METYWQERIGATMADFLFILCSQSNIKSREITENVSLSAAESLMVWLNIQQTDWRFSLSLMNPDTFIALCPSSCWRCTATLNLQPVSPSVTCDLSGKLHPAVRNRIRLQLLLHISYLWLLKTVMVADSYKRNCWWSTYRTRGVKKRVPYQSNCHI